MASKDSGKVTLYGREIHWECKGRFHSLARPFVYDCEANDYAAGISVKAKNFRGKRGARKRALKKLCDDLAAQGILKV